VSGVPVITGRRGFRCTVRAAKCLLALLLFLAFAPAECRAAPPAVTITEPGGGAILSGAATVRGTAASNNASRLVILVEVQVDSGEWKTAAGTTAWSFSLDTAPLEDGWHTLGARSFDGQNYSEPARVDFESHNAGASTGGIAFAICLVLVVALAIFLVAALFYYLSKFNQPVKAAPVGFPAPAPGPAYPQRQLYIDRTGRLSRYPIAESPYYRPPPPAFGVSQSGRPPPRLFSPAGGPTSDGTVQVAPQADEPIPVPPVVEHDSAPAPVYGGLEIEDTDRPDAEIGKAPVTEVLEVEVVSAPEAMEAADMAEPAALEAAEAPPTNARPSPAGRRHERVRMALMKMPRGLPLPLLGVTMDELSDLILGAPRQSAPGGSPVVRLKGRWYRADENNLNDFMVEYRP
jgi:hypothetical protein